MSKPDDPKASSGAITVKAKNITTTVKETHRTDARNTSHNAGGTFQQKSGKGYTVSNEDKQPKKNPQVVPQANRTTKQVQLPLLIGYSLGFDNDHKYLKSLNSDVKYTALTQMDSKSGQGENIPYENCDNLDGISDIQAQDNMLYLINSQTSTKNGTYNVGEDMVNRFMNSAGGEYENNTLNSVVESDPNFIFFKRAVIYKILIKLKSVDWDISKLIPNQLVRFFNVAFNTEENHEDGLTILIDAVEHIEVYLIEYKPPNHSGDLYIKLKFVLYDTFGLDLEDVQKYGVRKSHAGLWRNVATIPVSTIGLIQTIKHYKDWKSENGRIYVQNNYGSGFSSWWILQHRLGRKPFVTKVTNFQPGHYNKYTVYRSPKNPEKNTLNDMNYGQLD